MTEAELQFAARIADYRARMFKERAYCEQIRDAKAAGRPPLTAAEFFATRAIGKCARETILEL